MKKDWRLVGEILVQEFMHLSRRIKFYLRLILVAEGAAPPWLVLGQPGEARGLGDALHHWRPFVPRALLGWVGASTEASVTIQRKKTK